MNWNLRYAIENPRQTIQYLHTLATHPNTPLSEAENAVRFRDRFLSQYGLTLEDVIPEMRQPREGVEALPAGQGRLPEPPRALETYKPGLMEEILRQIRGLDDGQPTLVPVRPRPQGPGGGAAALIPRGMGGM